MAHPITHPKTGAGPAKPRGLGGVKPQIDDEIKAAALDPSAAQSSDEHPQILGMPGMRAPHNVRIYWCE
jgi:hypothetical protein